MGCFVVPLAEAVVTTLATKFVQSRERKHTPKSLVVEKELQGVERIPFSAKLGWLNKMLWGGSALLAFEHLWHGEVVPYFPFLTAVQNGETSEMLAEMGSVGVLMAVLVTLVWAGMVLVSHVLEKKMQKRTEWVSVGEEA